MIADWQSAGTHGTPHSVRGARNMSIDLEVETDELRGDDVVLDQHSKIVAATVNFEIATLDLELFDLILGGTLIQSADYYNFDFDPDEETPYVGIAGRIVGSGGEADLHIFLPKAKLSSNLSLAAQVDTYMLPTATFRAVDDDGALYRLRNFTAPTALDIPLRTATGGF